VWVIRPVAFVDINLNYHVSMEDWVLRTGNSGLELQGYKKLQETKLQMQGSGLLG